VAQEESETATVSPETCSLPPYTGICRAYFERWAFHPDQGRCEMFVYGGCNGNDNRFNSEEECMQKCGGRETDLSLQPRSRSGSIGNASVKEEKSGALSKNHECMSFMMIVFAGLSFFVINYH